jgi:hypothetical protein
MQNNITSTDLAIITQAKAALEHQSLAMHLSSIAGAPVDLLVQNLPGDVCGKISKVVTGSLNKATQWAFLTAGSKENPIMREDWMHKCAVVASGAAGGFLGLVSTLWELPLSTMLMLRSIGCIAEQEGLNMADAKTRLGCVSVLSMGANPKTVDADELGYWVTRKSMAALVTQVLEWNGKGVAPALVRFITETAARYGVTVTEKVAMQFAPAVGALTGATLNHIFLDHYQSVAHAHFSIERLCLTYGESAVKEAYARA